MASPLPYDARCITFIPGLSRDEALLEDWVSSCLREGIQELDTIVVTAPDDLKQAFSCYDSMADAVEVSVGRSWRRLAIDRLLTA